MSEPHRTELVIVGDVCALDVALASAEQMVLWGRIVPKPQPQFQVKVDMPPSRCFVYTCIISTTALWDSTALAHMNICENGTNNNLYNRSPCSACSCSEQPVNPSPKFLYARLLDRLFFRASAAPVVSSTVCWSNLGMTALTSSLATYLQDHGRTFAS